MSEHIPDGLRDIEESWSLDDLQAAHQWLDYLEASSQRAEAKARDEANRRKR